MNLLNMTGLVAEGRGNVKRLSRSLPGYLAAVAAMAVPPALMLGVACITGSDPARAAGAAGGCSPCVTRNEAKAWLHLHGLREIGALRQIGRGIWIATIVVNGRTSSVGIDQGGNIGFIESADAPAPPSRSHLDAERANHPARSPNRETR